VSSGNYRYNTTINIVNDGGRAGGRESGGTLYKPSLRLPRPSIRSERSAPESPSSSRRLELDEAAAPADEALLLLLRERAPPPLLPLLPALPLAPPAREPPREPPRERPLVDGWLAPVVSDGSFSRHVGQK